MTTFGNLLPRHRYNPRTDFAPRGANVDSDNLTGSASERSNLSTNVERVLANPKDREGNATTPCDPARGVGAAGTPLGTCYEMGGDSLLHPFNKYCIGWRPVTPHLKGFVEPTLCQNGPTCDHPFCPEHNDFPESSAK